MKKVIAVMLLALLILPAATTNLVRKASGLVMILSPVNRGGGTGFHIKYNDKSYIVTNRHVCEVAMLNKKKELVVDIAWDHEVRRKKVLAVHPEADLCLIEPVFDSGFSRFHKPTSHTPTFTIGHGATGPARFRAGQFVAKHTYLVCVEGSFLGCAKVARMKLDAYDIPNIPGDSGSPVFDITGALIGVMAVGGGGMGGAAVPIEYLLEMLNE